MAPDLESTTPTAWPVVSLRDVTPDDVSATLGGGRPVVMLGCVHIQPPEGVHVDMYATLDRSDAIARAWLARNDELRRMLRSTDRAAS